MTPQKGSDKKKNPGIEEKTKPQNQGRLTILENYLSKGYKQNVSLAEINLWTRFV